MLERLANLQRSSVAGFAFSRQKCLKILVPHLKIAKQNSATYMGALKSIHVGEGVSRKAGTISKFRFFLKIRTKGPRKFVCLL